MHTYLNIDRVLGFPIQPMNYSSETKVSDRGVSIRVAIHYYLPVKPMIIEAPEMILELRANVDSNGRMEYQLSNYFASPEDLKALAPHLPEGTCLILLEDGLLSVESLDEPGMESSGGFSESNYSMCGDPTQSVGTNFGGNDVITGIPQRDVIPTLLGASAVPVNTIKGGFDVARITQKTISTWSKGARVLGRAPNILTVATVSYDFATGNANTSTLVNAGVAIVGAGIVFAVGISAAPWVIAGGIVYGIFSLAGGDDWLNSKLDISDDINFVTP